MQQNKTARVKGKVRINTKKIHVRTVGNCIGNQDLRNGFLGKNSHEDELNFYVLFFLLGHLFIFDTRESLQSRAEDSCQRAGELAAFANTAGL